MIHIAGASHLYGQRLNGEPFSRFELKSTEDSEIIDELLLELDRIDQSLLKNIDREDEEVTYTKPPKVRVKVQFLKYFPN